MKLTIEQGKLWLRFPYDAELIRRVKALPSAHWHEPYKAWTFPLTRVAYEQLKQGFGVSCREVEVAISRKHIVVLSHGQFKTKPFKHQLDAVKFLLNQFGLEVE